MIKLIFLAGTLALAGCATTPCYNVQTDETTHQLGIVLRPRGSVEFKKTSDYACPETVDDWHLEPDYYPE